MFQLSLYFKKKCLSFFINTKFWLKIYLASFWQIPQIKFINNDQPVILNQESLEHASFVSLLQLDEFESFHSVACKISGSQCSLSDLEKRLNCELKRVVVKTDDQTFHTVWYKDALLGAFGPQNYFYLGWFELRCLKYMHSIIFVWCLSQLTQISQQYSLTSGELNSVLNKLSTRQQNLDSLDILWDGGREWKCVRGECAWDKCLCIQMHQVLLRQQLVAFASELFAKGRHLIAKPSSVRQELLGWLQLYGQKHHSFQGRLACSWVITQAFALFRDIQMCQYFVSLHLSQGIFTLVAMLHLRQLQVCSRI